MRLLADGSGSTIARICRVGRRHAAVVLALVAAVLVAPPAVGQPRGKNDDLARARALDREGAKAYSEGRYNDAIRYFEEAHRLGGPPFELWNVAKCHLRLDQPEQAADMLEKYLATPTLPKDDREEAQQQLDSLKKRPSTLTVSSTPTGAHVTVDGRTVEGRTPLSVSISTGPHTVTVSSPTTTTYTQKIEARYGRAVIVDAALVVKDNRPPPPTNPYEPEDEAARITLRGALALVFTRHGSIGGSTGVGLLAFGTYRVAEVGTAAIAVGGLAALSGDGWDNRTGVANATPVCGPINDAQSATAFSLFGIGTATLPIHPQIRIAGIGGLGVASYLADNLGGDLFVPTCNASPGVRPAVLFGAQLDYLVSRLVRLSAFPLTWQIQPAFDGTRAAPRDASGVWMRFGFGIGAGVDL